MSNLLIFFALPIATVIISIALQKIFRNPLLVAAIIFAIFLVITFIIDDVMFLVPTIVYTIIAYITAVIVKFIKKILRQLCRREEQNENNNTTSTANVINITDDANRIDVNPSVFSNNMVNGRNYRYR